MQQERNRERVPNHLEEKRTGKRFNIVTSNNPMIHEQQQ